MASRSPSLCCRGVLPSTGNCLRAGWACSRFGVSRVSSFGLVTSRCCAGAPKLVLARCSTGRCSCGVHSFQLPRF
eukprot:15474170-Alexandrium_andersonii.AAC.1